MITLRELRQIIDDYTLYLLKGGTPIYLKTFPRESKEGYIHASSIGMCSQAAMKEDRGVPYTYPAASPEEMPASRMRMLEGQRMALIIQEALVWYYRDDLEASVDIEHFCYSPTLRVQGNIDAMVRLNELQGYFVEIKHVAYGYNKSPGPKQSHLLQAMSYYKIKKEVFPEMKGFLAVMATPNWREQGNPRSALRLYEVVPYQDQWMLLDEDGEVPRDYDVPIGISDSAFRDIVDNFVLSDFLNPFTSWQCGYMEKKPEGAKPGRYRIRCPHWCHGVMPESGEVTLKFWSDLDDYYTFR